MLFSKKIQMNFRPATSRVAVLDSAMGQAPGEGDIFPLWSAGLYRKPDNKANTHR
jgi:hypothetical protein